jgi:hypothetical protein
MRDGSAGRILASILKVYEGRQCTVAGASRMGEWGGATVGAQEALSRHLHPFEILTRLLSGVQLGSLDARWRSLADSLREPMSAGGAATVSSRA